METIPLSGIAHLGIRVFELERSLAFYRLLGFEKTLGPIGQGPVVILMHPSGVELNLVLNAPEAKTPNVLMDVPVKAPGITHVALSCPDLDAASRVLAAAGIPITERATFPNGSQALFIRDPDGVVLELNHAS